MSILILNYPELTARGYLLKLGLFSVPAPSIRGDTSRRGFILSNIFRAVEKLQKAFFRRPAIRTRDSK